MHCRRPFILASVVAVAALSLLASGCGGGGSPGIAYVASTTTAGATSVQNGTTTVENGSVAGALAFARCMRSHGMPNWPDPDSNGKFDKSKLRQLDPSGSRVRAIEEKSCNYSFQNGGQSKTVPIPPADQPDYVRAAACVRSRGFPDFPDPTFRDGGVVFNIPASIDTNSSQFRSARATCEKLIPAGLPDSGANPR